MNHQRVYPVFICKLFGNKYSRVGITFYMYSSVLEYAATYCYYDIVERLFEKL